MKASAFLNLPMQSGRRLVINLHAINAEVVLLRQRVFCVNQRQSDKWPTVFLPGGEHRQLVQTRRAIQNFRNRSARYGLRTEFQEVANERTMLPKLRTLRWQQRFRDLYQLLNELFGLLAESEINSLRRPEQIGDYRKGTSLHSLEKQSRTACFDYASMNLGKFEVGIYFNFDGKKIVFAPQEVEEGAEVAMHL